MESFKVLFEEKKHFYKNDDNNRAPELEEIRVKEISNRYHLDKIYYDLDNHNIFKRTDRYRFKVLYIILFSLLVIFNIFEIIFNIVMLNMDKKSEDYTNSERIITSFISILNILVTLILSSFSIIKMKISSSIYY